jgi:hypothetical protein
VAVEAVLHPDPASFPIGQTVKVRVRPTVGGPLTGEPSGSILSEPAVATDGSLTVTGLTVGKSYVGYASVGGKDRYLSFVAGSAFYGPEEGRPFRLGQTFAIQGAVSESVVPGFPISLGPTEHGVNLVKVRAFTTAGTVACKIQKNGLDAGPFIGMTASSAGVEKTGSLPVAENDILTLVITGVTGGENLSVACFLEPKP